jgi:hypothetical protein
MLFAGAIIGSMPKTQSPFADSWSNRTVPRISALPTTWLEVRADEQ